MAIAPGAQQGRDLGIADRPEIAIELANGAEVDRRQQTHDLVCVGAQSAQCILRRYADGHHQPRRVPGAQRIQGSDQRGAGGDAVIHHHHQPAGRIDLLRAVRARAGA